MKIAFSQRYYDEVSKAFFSEGNLNHLIDINNYIGTSYYHFFEDKSKLQLLTECFYDYCKLGGTSVTHSWTGIQNTEGK